MSDFTPFPETRWTALRALKSDDNATRQLGWDVVARLYWHPVVSYVCVKWNLSEHDAQDTAQNFFTFALERDTLAKYEPGKARFRSFLRVCLDRFLINEHHARSAQKRGGGRVESIETAGADGTPLDPVDPEKLDDLFEREWRRSLFEAAVSEVETSCATDTQKLQFALFRRYDIDRGSDDRLTYDDLAREFNLSVTSVTNHLHAVRTRVRLALLEQLRAITASEQEFLEESQALFGARPAQR